MRAVTRTSLSSVSEWSSRRKLRAGWSSPQKGHRSRAVIPIGSAVTTGTSQDGQASAPRPRVLTASRVSLRGR